MLDSSHIKELDRIFKEICNINEKKVSWKLYISTKSLFHFSEPDVCTRITVDEFDNTNISITSYKNDLMNCHFTCNVNCSTRDYSIIYNNRYYSDGSHPLMYDNKLPSEISKEDYFNEMIINPSIPNYDYLMLAPEVDNFFIHNEISGSLLFSISTINLKKITFKQYF